MSSASASAQKRSTSGGAEAESEGSKKARVERTALVAVDVQNDFLPPNGSLAVARGDEILTPLLALLGDGERWALRVATLDWHPEGHCSFAATHADHSVGDTVRLANGVEQRLWPTHCVQKSAGAELAPALRDVDFDHIIKKGLDRNVDSYSAFKDNASGKSTELDAVLKDANVTHVYVCGLALDVCGAGAARRASARSSASCACARSSEPPAAAWRASSMSSTSSSRCAPSSASSASSAALSTSTSSAARHDASSGKPASAASSPPPTPPRRCRTAHSAARCSAAAA